jgi:polyisoprenoid-binding protein YceI
MHSRPTAILGALVLAACSAKAQAPAMPAPDPGPMPAGAYAIDKSHASVVFRVSHMGFSNYTARFNDVSATVQLDPAHPERSSVTATIKAASLDTGSPLPTFNAQIAGKEFLDAEQFPDINFRSTRVEMTGDTTAKVTGDLTLHGVTRPVVLDVRFNGGYAGFAMDPGGARAGFSATTAFKRSDFGVSMGVPAPGTTMGVGDEVRVAIEAEFNKPKA